MKSKALLILVLLLSHCLSHALIELPSYGLLCQYDSDCTRAARIKNKVLVIKSIPAELLTYYKILRPTIIKVANLYKVDPVTLVLTPLAENTMNVNITDELQDELVLNGSAPEGSFLGREMSIGPGQIYTSAAMKVEALAAQIEGRQLRTKKEVTRMLLTPEGALRYAAAIIRNAQDVYQQNGFDITRRPEILATLYNIGKPSQRVKQTLYLKRMPYPNYFGYFVGKSYDYVKSELNLPSILE